jgi:hypothetical protein
MVHLEEVEKLLVLRLRGSPVVLDKSCHPALLFLPYLLILLASCCLPKSILEFSRSVKDHREKPIGY